MDQYQLGIPVLFEPGTFRQQSVYARRKSQSKSYFFIDACHVCFRIACNASGSFYLVILIFIWEKYMNVLKKAIRDFIIGRGQYISSTTQYRNAMLRGLIAMIGILIGLLYIFIDSASAIGSGFVWYGLLLVLSAMTLWLNRIRKYVWASFLLILASNGVIFVFASSEGPSLGVYFFFITTGLATLVLLGYKHRNFGLVLALMSYLIAMAAYFGRFQITPLIEYAEEYKALNF